MINSHSVPIEKLSKAYTHQKIEFTRSQRGEKVMPAQQEVALTMSLLELLLKNILLNNKKNYAKNSTLIIL